MSSTATIRTILHLQQGERCTIKTIVGSGSIRQRLLDMGLLPKQEVFLKRIAPGGSPIWIEISNSQLALRREEAAMVQVANCSE